LCYFENESRLLNLTKAMTKHCKYSWKTVKNHPYLLVMPKCLMGTSMIKVE